MIQHVGRLTRNGGQQVQMFDFERAWNGAVEVDHTEIHVERE